MKYSPQQLIEMIQDFHAREGRLPSAKNNMPVSAYAYEKTFGSWREAIIAAGFEPRTRPEPSQEVICEQCDTPFLKQPSQIKKSKNNFCSSSCAAKFNNRGVRRHGKPKGNCLYCGEQLYKSAKEYCNNTCTQAWKNHLRALKVESTGILTDGWKYPASIKKYLIRERGNACEDCGITEWTCGLTNGETQLVPLVMDHIDGNAHNWHVSNLRLLCGNCNMFTPTFGGKNAGNGRRTWKMKRYYEEKKFEIDK